MRKILEISIVLFALISCLMSCNKNDESQSAFDDLHKYHLFSDLPIAIAQKNIPQVGSFVWSANVFVSKTFFHPDKLTFQLFTFDEDVSIAPIYREGLEMNNIPIEAGKYFFSDSSINLVAFGRLLADGDVPEKSWFLNPTFQSYLEIECVDKVNRVIEVSFNLFLENGEKKRRLQSQP